VPLGEGAEAAALRLLAQLRRAGIASDMAFKGNMKKRMARADASGARFAVIIGEDELAKGQAGVKDLRTGEQQSVDLDRVAETVCSR